MRNEVSGEEGERTQDFWPSKLSIMSILNGFLLQDGSLENKELPKIVYWKLTFLPFFFHWAWQWAETWPLPKQD
jgi:hypothetical protein